jgi:amphi-Trp domain-containing protein
MEIEKSLNLNRKQLADLLRKIAEQLEAGGVVQSETLNASVNPREPIFVKLEYEDKVGEQKIELDIHLVGTGEQQSGPVKF